MQTVAARSDEPLADSRTRAEITTEALVDAIITGRLAPGSPLRLQELAAELDVSAMPVREAIRQVVALGLAVHSPRRGARVCELSIEDLCDIYSARLLLEVPAIRLAAARFTEADAEAATVALSEHVEASEAGDLTRARTAHSAFHFALYNASGSSWLQRLIKPLSESAERYRLLSLEDRGTLDERKAEHERILDACIAHNPERAGRELQGHLSLTANLVAQQMGEEAPF